MITYKDMTFCTAECKNKYCARMLTKDIITAAKKADMPISVADCSLGCEGYREKPIEEYYVK